MGRQWHSLVSALRWLTRPPDSLPEPLRRRAHLLTWLLLLLLLLTVATLVLVMVVNLQHTLQHSQYVLLIICLAVVLALAYGLNRAGHFYTSAVLTIATSIFGPWISILLDATILRGDFVPLTYVTLTVLLSSILLPTSVTIGVASLQFLLLAFVLWLSNATAFGNWTSLLVFVFFTSVLSIIASAISRRDMEQIDRQTGELLLSEAQLRELSVRDHLTNLFNRRYLEETLEREIQRATRKEYPLGLIMLDIDHFKTFNDSLGHVAGDALLHELGNLLSEHVRTGDVACRYGGEEFVLILPEASLDATKARAELLREEVRHLHVEHKARSLGTVTVSLGVAGFPNHGVTGEAVLESADAALYRAKREGRNRVVVADGS